MYGGVFSSDLHVLYFFETTSRVYVCFMTQHLTVDLEVLYVFYIHLIKAIVDFVVYVDRYTIRCMEIQFCNVNSNIVIRVVL
jgi:hypothetical protein